MKAVILAAGVGRRLGNETGGGPKSLLRFGGKSLLQRHIEILGACGVSDVAIVVGHGAAALREEIGGLGLRARIAYVENPRYREGSMVSLWSAREFLRAGEAAVVMDADVLYDARLMRALVSANAENCVLLDRDVEPGDEPMKLCIRGGQIVDLHKRPQAPYDWYGENIGFNRCSAPVAAALAERTETYVREGRTDVEHEEAIRDLIVASPGTFGFVDVTGLPWMEIDFPEDVARARAEIFPKLMDS